jgi:excisionase family DNA binding protein
MAGSPELAIMPDRRGFSRPAAANGFGPLQVQLLSPAMKRRPPKKSLHHLPNWPRLLSEEVAAAYLSVSKSTFRRWVEAGKFPAPIREGRRVLWDRHLIDQILNIRIGFLPAANDEADTSWHDFT